MPGKSVRDRALLSAKPGSVANMKHYDSPILKDHLGSVPADKLGSFAHMHIRGGQATQELIEAAGYGKGMKIADIGAGMGGSSLMLAAAGCDVVAVEPTPALIQAGRTIAEKLGSTVRFVEGGFPDVPLESGAFDGVWMQHMNMHIADKSVILGEVYRLLKPGGKLAIHELFGDQSRLTFPLPWSSDGSFSYVVPFEAYVSAAEAAGLRKLRSWSDAEKSREGLQAMLEMEPGRSPLEVLNGEAGKAMLPNALAALNSGAIDPTFAIFEKP